MTEGINESGELMSERHMFHIRNNWTDLAYIQYWRPQTEVGGKIKLVFYTKGKLDLYTSKCLIAGAQQNWHYTEIYRCQ
jgi:hypothetical protein